VRRVEPAITTALSACTTLSGVIVQRFNARDGHNAVSNPIQALPVDGSSIDGTVALLIPPRLRKFPDPPFRKA
jgi:hypothetical protein